MLDLFPDSARIEQGELELGGVRDERARGALRDAARRLLRGHAARRARAVRAQSAPDALVVYGAKAFPNVAVLRLFAEEGIGADVASAGELAFARAAGLDGRSSSCTGTAKSTRSSLGRGRRGRDGRARRARRGGAGGSAQASDAAAGPRDARRRGRHARGDPDRAPRLEVRASTGAGRDVLTLDALARLGIDVPASTSTSARSSRTSPPRRRRSAASRPSPPAAAKSLGWDARARELGGGFGDQASPRRRGAGRRRARGRGRGDGSQRLPGRAGLPEPAVWLEPGRALVGQAGVTLYRVGSVKRLDGTDLGRGRRRDVGQSASAALRRALHGAAQRAARRRGARRDSSASPGMHCESGDVLIDDVSLPVAAARRPARGPGDRRIHARDELELQRRPTSRGRARRATAMRA